MYEQELEKTVRERTENQKKWEDDKELIRRQERSLEDKKEALIHKKTETENQEHTYQLYQNELEIRKNILKYLDMEERHILHESCVSWRSCGEIWKRKRIPWKKNI